ncbi:MAG: hypothetical protein ABR587_06110 [Candidatus Binatia bacterium]
MAALLRVCGKVSGTTNGKHRGGAYGVSCLAITAVVFLRKRITDVQSSHCRRVLALCSPVAPDCKSEKRHTNAPRCFIGASQSVDGSARRLINGPHRRARSVRASTEWKDIADVSPCQKRTVLLRPSAK